PDADRLKVCTVDLGDGDADGEGGRPPATIVCGAPNVAAGQTVAVARPGAVMPDGSKLGTAKLRGIESHGMILAEEAGGIRPRGIIVAEEEVAMGTERGGMMVLEPDGLNPGTPLGDVLPITTDVL